MSSGPGKMPSKSIKVVPGRSKLRVESSNPVPRGNPNRKPSKVKLISPQEAMKLPSGATSMAVSPTPKSLRPVPSRRAPETTRPIDGIRREIVCGLRALSSVSITKVRQRTNPTRLQTKTFESPPSPRALQIRSRVKQQEANATQEVVKETVMEVCDIAKDNDSMETCQSTSEERVSELLLYRPALHPIWKGRIVDSARLSEFDCEFWAKPASNISRKALRLSKSMPLLLEAELLSTGPILNDVFHRSPKLSDIDMYFFPDKNKTERFKGEHDHLFDAMATRNAMIKANVNGTELSIFSSKLLDKISQFFVNTQKKQERFLWGCFLHTRSSQPPVPETYQTDEVDVVDMNVDTEHLTSSLAHKLIAESQSSPVKANEEVGSPPGFEKLWRPPLVKLNIHGTSKTHSDLTGSAGIVRNQSGQWLFGYSRCHHTSLPEVVVGLIAIHHGLKLLWDTGFRRVRLETTSLEIIDALTTESTLFRKRKSVIGLCKDMVLKEWECEIYHISKEQNSCAECLASRLENQPQGFVFYEDPPRRLVNRLEKDLSCIYR